MIGSGSRALVHKEMLSYYAGTVTCASLDIDCTCILYVLYCIIGTAQSQPPSGPG